MTYYRIKKYLIGKGLTPGEADYVRGMIRELVNPPKPKVVDRFTTPKKGEVQNPRCNGYCSDPTTCGGGCYVY